MKKMDSIVHHLRFAHLRYFVESVHLLLLIDLKAHLFAVVILSVTGPSLARSSSILNMSSHLPYVYHQSNNYKNQFLDHTSLNYLYL